MPINHAKELIFRAYTSNQNDFKKEIKRIRAYVKQEAVGRHLFEQSGLWKNFVFNEQSKQWEMQEPSDALSQFEDMDVVLQYKSHAEYTVTQYIGEQLYQAIKGALEGIGSEEELMLENYLKEINKSELINILNKIHHKGYLDYYQHSCAQGLVLDKSKSELLRQLDDKETEQLELEELNQNTLKKLETRKLDTTDKAKVLDFIAGKEQKIKKVKEQIENIKIKITNNEHLQNELFKKQMETFFNEDYFSIQEKEPLEIPTKLLQEYLVLENEKIKILRMEKGRLDAEKVLGKGGSNEDPKQKQDEITEITNRASELRKQLSTNMDAFSAILNKKSTEPTLFADQNWSTTIFSMINNDAWLDNSNLQGGELVETANIFLELAHEFAEKDEDANSLKKVIATIKENQQKVIACIWAGKMLEDERNLILNIESMYRHFTLQEYWELPETDERAKDTLYITNLRGDRERFVVHYYDGQQWCISKVNNAIPDIVETKTEEDNTKKINIIVSKFWIDKDLEIKNAQTLENKRFDLIKALARDFSLQINALNEGEGFFIPGGFFGHVMLYEFKKETNGTLSLIVYNTGSGLEYHENQITFQQGVFKEKHFPAYVYQFPIENIATPAFQEYLGELLKANIASSWNDILSRSQVKGAAKKYDVEDLYVQTFPLALDVQLQGKKVDPKTVVSEHLSFITGQRSGKCAEAVFHPITRMCLGERKYQRFMCAYRKETIAHFVKIQQTKGQLSHPIIERQIRNALANLSRRLYKNQEVFTYSERKAVTKFVAEMSLKLDFALQTLVTDGLAEQPITFKESIFESENFPPIKQTLDSIDTTWVQNTMKHSKEVLPEEWFGAICEPKDTAEILISKLESLLSVLNVQSKMTPTGFNPEEEDGGFSNLEHVEKPNLEEFDTENQTNESTFMVVPDETYPEDESGVTILPDDPYSEFDALETSVENPDLIEYSLRTAMASWPMFETEKKTIVESQVDPKMVVFQIEKLLMSWSLNKENLECTSEQRDKIIENVKQLINMYSQYNLCQWGGSQYSYLPQLLPQHIVTLLSALAIIVQSLNKEEAFCTKALIGTMGFYDLQKHNTLNPYLASTEFQCDSQLKELSAFFKQFPTVSSRKDIFVKLIEENADHKKCLLEVYNRLIMHSRDFKDQKALPYLNGDVEKCLLVLCRCTLDEIRTVINNDDDFKLIQALVKKFDFLVNVENICLVLGRMISQGIQNDQAQLFEKLNAQNLHFVAEANIDGTYHWAFNTLSPKLQLVKINPDALKRSKRDIKDKRIVDFLDKDFNKNRKENEFYSSAIQVGDTNSVGVALTQEEFLFKQFCHTRSAPDFQVLSTIHFFQEQMRLLADKKWQTLCECNIFQPGLLLKTLEETPVAYDNICGFLRKGLRESLLDETLNASADFFIKLNLYINHYLIESESNCAKSAVEQLEILNAVLSEHIQKSKNDKTKSKLMHYQTLLLGRLIPHTAEENQEALIQLYVKNKLFNGEIDSVETIENPIDFRMQEKVAFNMATHLMQHKAAVMSVCYDRLRELNIFPDSDPVWQYPNVWYSYKDGAAGNHSVVINLENGQMLKDGKAYLPLPEILFNNQEFLELFDHDVKHAFHCMFPGDSIPSAFEINHQGTEYWIKKTRDGYIFQKNLPSQDGKLARFQLIPYKTLEMLSSFIPQTLLDKRHHFWLSVKEPKKLIITDKSTQQEICRLTCLFNNELNYIEAEPFEIWTQKRAANSVLGKLFSEFEHIGFIEVREFHPDYTISLPRYQLVFKVISINPLVIRSENPMGTVLLSNIPNDLANIKNAIFLKKDSGENVALLPRQCFIMDTQTNPEFEYTPVTLDLQGKQIKSDRQYCNQSEFLEFPLDENGKLLARNSEDALYLVYVHLANFDPDAALRILHECEKSGGIKASQRELEHLMLILNGLPADDSKRVINTPEFIAVKAYALYLYASAKYKNTMLDKIEPKAFDAKYFYKEAKCFYEHKRDPLDKNFQDCVREVFLKYENLKNKIPVTMQLTMQQELECLSLLGSPLTTVQKDKLQSEYFLKEQLLSPEPTQSKIKTVRDRILKSRSPQIQTQYHKKTHEFAVFTTQEKQWVDLPRMAENPEISGKYLSDCMRLIESKEKIEMAMQKLTVSLDLEDFLKDFLTYYHIATSNNDEKEKLKEYLECKLKILAHQHYMYAQPLPGEELLISLYSILANKHVRFKSIMDFFEEVAPSRYVEDHWIKERIGYCLNGDKLYDYLIKEAKNFPVRLTLENVQDKAPDESRNIEEFFAASTEPLTKRYSDQKPKWLAYPPGIDILEKYKVPSVDTIIASSDLVNFVSEYQQLERNEKALSSDTKNNFQKETQELSESPQYSFENLASQELHYEQKLGEIQNKSTQEKVALSIRYFSSEEQQTRLQQKTEEGLGYSKLCRDELLNRIKHIMNQGHLSKDVDRLRQLGLQGKIIQECNEQEIMNLYLLGDEKSIIDATGLSAEQAATIYSLITEYLFISSHCQQLESLQKKLTDLKDIEEKDKPIAFADIAQILVSKNHVDPSKDSAALSVFQCCGEVLLRSEQIDYLRSHMEMEDDQFKNILSQLIMGFGKTFLLPIIAKAKAKGTNLSVIEVPDALFETNVNDLHNASMRFLNQKTKSLRFNRNTSCQAYELRGLYEWLVMIKQNRDYLVTTGESVASINLRYIEILKYLAKQQTVLEEMVVSNKDKSQQEKVLAELKSQAYWLEKIVKLFKFEADAIVDEAHSGFNVRKKLIYSLGLEGLDQSEINASIKLYEFLLPIKVYHNYTIEDIIKYPSVVPPGEDKIWEEIKSIIADRLVTGQDSPISSVLNEVDKTIIKSYLLNTLTKEQIETIEIHFFSKLSETNKNILSLYKAELTRLLPATLKKENGKHYGLLSVLGENQFLKQPCAVPFVASNTPHIISRQGQEVRTTHYANPNETINYTIQAYISEGLPVVMVRSILDKLKEQAKFELIRDNRATYDSTDSGALFRDLINEQGVNLDNFDQDSDRLNNLIKKLQKNKRFIFYALEYEILSTIKVEDATLEHNSNQHAYLYHTLQGIGGTTDNYRSIARMKFDQQKYMGTNGITIDHLLNKVKSSDIHVLDNSDEDLVVKLLKPNVSKEHLTHSIVDVGGLFTGVTNFMVAQKIAKYFKSIDEKQRKYVLFFNDENQFCAININNPQDVKVIGSTDKAVIKKVLNCKEDEWFTYYDQFHTEGTNVLQSSSAKASITFSYNTTRTEFIQGAMRMRGLPKDQRLDVFMESNVLKSCFNRDDSNNLPAIDEIIMFFDKNETTALSEEHLRYVLQEMDNVLYQELLLIILKETGSDDPVEQMQEQVVKAKILSIINEHSSLFLKNRVESLFKRYGGVDNKDAELKIVLEDKKQFLIQLRERLLGKISVVEAEDKEKTETFESDLKTLIQDGLQSCNPTVLFRENFDLNAEVEAEAETEAETAAESEIEAELEVSKIKQEPKRTVSKPDSWVCDNINSLIRKPELFDELKQYIMPLPDMLKTTKGDSIIGLDNKLYISKNHVNMYMEQNNTFDDYRLPIQKVLMIRHSNGTLNTLIITPNEAQELSERKKDLFKGNNPQVWIQTSTGGVEAGARPPVVEQSFQYLKIQEQIQFINGDLKSLLMQNKYVWLPRHLENKKTMLSTKILNNRPDQVEYASKLLSRVKHFRRQYEEVALQLLQDVPVYTAVNSRFKGVLFENDVDNIQKVVDEILNLKEIKQLKMEGKDSLELSACKLIAAFQDVPIDNLLIQKLYPDLDNGSVLLLAGMYESKRILLQLKDEAFLKSAAKKGKIDVLKNQLNERLQALKNLKEANHRILITLFREAIVCDDAELMNVILSVCPDILNEILDTPHPVSLAIKHQDYFQLEYLLTQHFLNKKRESENFSWLQNAFDEACNNADMNALSILIKKSATLNLPIKLAEKVIIILTEYNRIDSLDCFCEKHQLSRSFKLIKEFQSACDYLVMSFRFLKIVNDRRGDSRRTFAKSKYIIAYPNFRIVSTGISQLMLACQEGDLDAYQQLVNNGANILEKTIPGSSPEALMADYNVFTFAVAGGNGDIIKNLMHREQVIEQLSLPNIKAIVSHLKTNIKRIDGNLISEVIETLVNRAAFIEKAKEFKDEISLLFEAALKNKNIILAERLIEIAAAQNIDLLASCPNVLVDCLNERNAEGVQILLQYNPMLVIKSSNNQFPFLKIFEIKPVNLKQMGYLITVFEKLPLQEKMNNRQFVLALQDKMCDILKRDGGLDIVKRLFLAMDDSVFRDEFLTNVNASLSSLLATRDFDPLHLRNIISVFKEFYPDNLEKDTLIFDLAKRNYFKVDFKMLDEILNLLEVKSILENESQKELLFKAAIEHNNTNCLFDCFLDMKLYDSIPSGIIQHMVEEPNFSKMLALTKLLKRSVDVEILLSVMYEQYTAEKQKQEEVGTSVLPNRNTLSYFIQCQLKRGEHTVDGTFFQLLTEKMGLKAMGEIVHISFRNLENQKGRFNTNELENMLSVYKKYPVLCASLLEYCQKSKFSDLPFYSAFGRLSTRFMQSFDAEFNQAAQSYQSHGTKPKQES